MTASETQPERTVLSWQRLGLSVLAVAGLLTHGAVLAHRPAGLAAATGIAVLALVVLAVAVPARHRRIRRAVEGGAPASAPRLAALATAVVAVVAATAAAVVLGSL